MIIDISKPSKMFCSFALKDARDESRTIFNAVTPKNENVGYVISEIVEAIPELNEDVRMLRQTETLEMPLLNAI